MKLKTTLIPSLLFLAILASGANASAGEVTLVGSERIVFTILTGTTSGVTYNGTCFIPRRATGWNYDVDNEPYFDGPVAPFSYVSGGLKKLHFNVSLGYKNYRLTSTINGSGAGATFTNGTLQCSPVFTAALSNANDTFTWAEWLYGTFRDVSTGRVYAAVYNEYYGGYYPGQDSYSGYIATGLARSLDNGASFSRIQTAPNHVILRLPSLRQNTTAPQGLSWFGGIFKSPLDQMYYIGANHYESGQTAMVRTNNLESPTSWRAWNGSGWNVPMAPLTQPFTGIGINPLYLGYNDYFKKYMAITIGSDDGYASGNNLIVYNLSDNLINWGPPRKIMYNPACGPDQYCFNDPHGEVSSYPSIMDPVYLSETGDSTKASNGMTGMTPFVTYIKNVNSGQTRQQFAVQQISLGQVVFNRMDNFSMRGVVDAGGRSLVMGFLMQGTEAKKFVFRGIGPSLPNFSYPKIANPCISLYNGSGSLMASNLGWRSLSTQDENYLISRGLNPSSDAESAIVVDVPGSASYGSFTVVMDNGYGMGVIEAYDMSSTAESRIAQVSVRGYSQPGDGAITMGFISRGGQQAVIRGTGASTLAPAGFSPVIPNPYVTVYNGAGGQIISNDNWSTDPNAGVIQNYGLAPGNSLESATMFSTATVLPSRFSVYTVQMQGTGYGLLELYNVNSN